MSRVRAVQYDIANEQAAVYRYISIMRTRGRDVEASQSGLLADSSCPWLGASPDRFIFDPEETQVHGLLEVKCPYSLRGKSPDEMGDSHCMKKKQSQCF